MIFYRCFIFIKMNNKRPQTSSHTQTEESKEDFKLLFTRLSGEVTRLSLNNTCLQLNFLKSLGEKENRILSLQDDFKIMLHNKNNCEEVIAQQARIIQRLKAQRDSLQEENRIQNYKINYLMEESKKRKREIEEETISDTESEKKLDFSQEKEPKKQKCEEKCVIDKSICIVSEENFGDAENQKYFYTVTIDHDNKKKLVSLVETFAWFTELSNNNNNIIRSALNKINVDSKTNVVKLHSYFKNKKLNRLFLTGQGVIKICEQIIKSTGETYLEQIEDVLKVVKHLVPSFQA